MKKSYFLWSFLTVATTYADPTCVWETTVPNLDTNVSEQGPLRFTGCSCNCASFRWFQGTICPTCNHAHAGAKTLGNQQFNFSWLPGLVTYVNKKNSTENKPLFTLADYSEDNNFYERPKDSTPSNQTSGGGILDDGDASSGLVEIDDTTYVGDGCAIDQTDYYQGQSLTSQAFDGPSIGVSEDEISGFNFGI